MEGHLNRCPWSESHPLLVEYHDKEWGVPQHDDRVLFEYLVLDGAQAGLSWLTILRKREAYRQALANFDVERIANYDEDRISRLLEDPGIVRNRQKVASLVTNARGFLAVQGEFGSFNSYLWSFTGHRTINNAWAEDSQIPAKTPESQALSRDLMGRGFKFVGPTICYAFMQGAGLVNDHLTACFRYQQVSS